MRRLLVLALAVVLLAVAATLGAGEWLSRAAPSDPEPAPAGLKASAWRVKVDAARQVDGWMIAGEPGRGAVVLLHGVRADRRQMTGRARFLARAGYTVLLIDLPAHGRSSGSRIGFGALEAPAVRAVLVELRRQLPRERIGVVAVSLGAAACVLGGCEGLVQAAVLESMYPTIDEAVANRLGMHLGAIGRAMAPLLLWQLPLRLDIGAEHLRPVDRIAALGAPLLLLSGTADRHTPWDETKRIFAAAKEPKELWPVPGAAHVDLHAFDPTAYEARMLGFLGRHLR